MVSDTPDRIAGDDEVAAPDEIVAALRAEIRRGEPWFPALLRAIARWRLPEEQIDGRRYVYLIAGEAFDWLLLAERLTDAIAGLVPADECDDLLFHGRVPADLGPNGFRGLIGPAKYRAHLNYLYGVLVEEALQLAVEEDRHKEIRCRAWGIDPRVDETAFQRIYGQGKEELLRLFREERGAVHTPAISLTESREFTYWLFKRRLRVSDPARVASDTQRGLAQLARLDRFRSHPAPGTTRAAETVVV